MRAESASGGDENGLRRRVTRGWRLKVGVTVEGDKRESWKIELS